MFIDNEPIIAECPLERGSVNRICYLSFKKLLISINGRIYTFDLSQISEFSFKNKILLLPLILGGILAPLSLIALINGLLHLWIMLISFMIGVLLTYYGLEGRNTLSIVTNIKEYDFFINSPSKNLKAFLQFADKIKHQNGQPRFYLEHTDELAENKSEIIDFNGGIELKDHAKDLGGKNILVIEPLSANARISYKEKTNGELAPYLIGKIRKEFLIPYQPGNDRSS